MLPEPFLFFWCQIIHQSWSKYLPIIQLCELFHSTIPSSVSKYLETFFKHVLLSKTIPSLHIHSVEMVDVHSQNSSFFMWGVFKIKFWIQTGGSLSEDVVLAFFQAFQLLAFESNCELSWLDFQTYHKSFSQAVVES